MMRKPGSLAILIAAVVGIGLTAAPASAKSLRLPGIQQIAQASVPKPNGIAYDPYSDEVFVTSVGPPPRVYIYREKPFVHEVGFINLPEGTDPGAAAFGADGYLYVVDHTGERVLVIDPESGEVAQSLLTPPSVQFVTGYVQLYHLTMQAARAVLDFGDSFSAGSIWYGSGFQQRLMMSDTITPNGGDLLTDIAKPSKGQISDELLIADAENNQLVRVSDSDTPAVLGTIGGLPGNPGLQPPRDLDINPLNLNTDVSGPALHPIYVPFPDLGVFESAGPNGPWIQIPSANIGRPTQVDSDCETVGATSFSQNLVTFFKQDQPKGSHCEDLVELLILAAPKQTTGESLGIQFALGIKAYVQAHGKLDILGGGGGARKQGASATEAKSKAKKVRLTAGRVTKVKLKLPSSVSAAVRAHRNATFKIRLRLTSPTGERAKVIRRIRARGG
jgi:hypothetical protein